MRVERNPHPTQRSTDLGKRFYHAFIFFDDCPECGTEDANEHYLSYPVPDMPARVHFECNDCGHDWERNVVVTVSVHEYAGSEDLSHLGDPKDWPCCPLCQRRAGAQDANHWNVFCCRVHGNFTLGSGALGRMVATPLPREER